MAELRNQNRRVYGRAVGRDARSSGIVAMPKDMSEEAKEERHTANLKAIENWMAEREARLQRNKRV